MVSHACFSQALNGTYTIGATSANYKTLGEAATALNTNGVSGKVIFNIQAGSYNEMISLSTIKGASAQNTVTFQSATKDSNSVVISHYGTSSGSNYVIQLSDASYVSFQWLTIQPSGSSFPSGILLIGKSHFNQFAHNVFIGTATNVVRNNNYETLFCIGSSEASNNQIVSNRFVNGGAQIQVIGASSVSVGTNNVIKKNAFVGTAGQSLIVQYQKNLLISANTFDGTRGYSTVGIEVDDCQDSLVIEKNKLTITGVNGITAVAIGGTSASANKPLVFKNNFISVASTDPNSEGRCFYIGSSSNVKLLNNSFNQDHAAGPMVSFGYQLTKLETYNNIFASSGTANPIEFFNPSIDTSQVKFDYNAYYSPTSPLFHMSGLTYDFETWRGMYKYEKHGMQTDPQYISNLDLHLKNTLALDGKGSVQSLVKDDVDGETRDMLHPDIGADEFSVTLSDFLDVQLSKLVSPDIQSCLFKDSLIVRVKNNSIFPVHSFDLKWTLFGVQRDSLHYNITLNPHDSVQLNMGYFRFMPNTFYQLDVMVTRPNGQKDQYFDNNVIPLRNYYLSNVKIQKRTDSECGGIELYIKKTPSPFIKWSEGSSSPSILALNKGVYNVTIRHENGCSVSDSIEIK